MSDASGASAPAPPRRWSFAALSERFGFSASRQFGIDLAACAGVCVAAALWGLFLFSQFDFQRVCAAFDFWFDSDPGRTVANITSRWTIFHVRSSLHPLYSLLIAGPLGLLGSAFGLAASKIVALHIALQCAALGGFMFAALRGFGLMRIDAVLLVTLLFSSAAAIYWAGFPEWIGFGAVSAVVPIAWAAAPSPLRNRITGAAQSLLSASIVITSWGIGMIASFLADWPKLSWKQAFMHTRDALAAIAALSVLQYLLFPGSGRMLDVWHQVGGVGSEYQWRMLGEIILEFFGQTLVAPQATIVEGAREGGGWGVMIITSVGQGVPLKPLTLLILALWLALAGLGAYAALRGRVRLPVIAVVAASFAFLFVMHVTFGGEIFLFSLMFAPFFVFVASWALLGKHRMLARGLCAVLIAASLAHNFPSFQAATTAHNAIDLSWLDRDHEASREAALTDCR